MQLLAMVFLYRTPFLQFLAVSPLNSSHQTVVESSRYLHLISFQTVDMLYFLLIMVVFLLAYGVAQQAILYPQEGPSWSVVSGVFFRPYFQVYGELFVEAPDTSKNNLISGSV